MEFGKVQVYIVPNRSLDRPTTILVIRVRAGVTRTVEGDVIILGINVPWTRITAFRSRV